MSKPPILNHQTLYPGERGYSKDGSWWIGLSREEFAKACAEQQLRLSGSHFGKVGTLALAESVERRKAE